MHAQQNPKVAEATLAKEVVPALRPAGLRSIGPQVETSAGQRKCQKADAEHVFAAEVVEACDRRYLRDIELPLSWFSSSYSCAHKRNSAGSDRTAACNEPLFRLFTSYATQRNLTLSASPTWPRWCPGKAV